MGDKITTNAATQHLASLRKRLQASGHSVPPALKSVQRDNILISSNAEVAITDDEYDYFDYNNEEASSSGEDPKTIHSKRATRETRAQAGNFDLKVVESDGGGGQRPDQVEEKRKRQGGRPSLPNTWTTVHGRLIENASESDENEKAGDIVVRNAGKSILYGSTEHSTRYEELVLQRINDRQVPSSRDYMIDSNERTDPRTKRAMVPWFSEASRFNFSGTGQADSKEFPYPTPSRFHVAPNHDHGLGFLTNDPDTSTRMLGMLQRTVNEHLAIGQGLSNDTFLSSDSKLTSARSLSRVPTSHGTRYDMPTSSNRKGNPDDAGNSFGEADLPTQGPKPHFMESNPLTNGLPQIPIAHASGYYMPIFSDPNGNASDGGIRQRERDFSLARIHSEQPELEPIDKPVDDWQHEVLVDGSPTHPSTLIDTPPMDFDEFINWDFLSESLNDSDGDCVEHN